jgi:Zn-dependent protease with chaperone function
MKKTIISSIGRINLLFGLFSVGIKFLLEPEACALIWVLAIVFAYYFGKLMFLESIAVYFYRLRQEKSTPNIQDAVDSACQKIGWKKGVKIFTSSRIPFAAFGCGLPGFRCVAIGNWVERILTQKEIVAVVTHELGHLKHLDWLVQLLTEVPGKTALFFSFVLFREFIVSCRYDVLPNYIILVFLLAFCFLAYYSVKEGKKIFNLQETWATGLAEDNFGSENVKKASSKLREAMNR